MTPDTASTERRQAHQWATVSVHDRRDIAGAAAEFGKITVLKRPLVDARPEPSIGTLYQPAVPTRSRYIALLLTSSKLSTPRTTVINEC